MIKRLLQADFPTFFFFTLDSFIIMLLLSLLFSAGIFFDDWRVWAFLFLLHLSKAITRWELLYTKTITIYHQIKQLEFKDET